MVGIWGAVKATTSEALLSRKNVLKLWKSRPAAPIMRIFVLVISELLQGARFRSRHSAWRATAVSRKTHRTAPTHEVPLWLRSGSGCKCVMSTDAASSPFGTDQECLALFLDGIGQSRQRS